MLVYFAVDNYYFFYSLSIFTIVIFIYRFIVLELDKKIFLILLMKLIGYYLLGVMVSMFALLSQIMTVLENDRIRSLSGFITYDNIRPYFEILNTFFNDNAIIANRLS